MSRPGVGLVEDRDLRPQHRQLQDLHPLLLAAREAVVDVAAGELARDVDQLHRRLGLAAEVLEADLRLAARLAVGVDRHPQVLGDGHAGDRDRVLEGHEQAGARALLGVGLGDLLAVEDDLALGDLERRVAHDRVRERRLAGAVRPHQRVDLAPRDLEVEALEDLLVLGAHVQVANLEVSHGLRSRLRLSVVRRSPAVLGDRLRRRRAGRRTRPARRASCPSSALVTPPWTRVHSSFVAQAWSPSVSCEHSTRPSRSEWKHSIGAIGPSSASTTSSIAISSAGRPAGSRRGRRGPRSPGPPRAASRPGARGRRAAASPPRRRRASATGSASGRRRRRGGRAPPSVARRIQPWSRTASDLNPTERSVMAAPYARVAASAAIIARVKLVIQIPCLNEEQELPRMLAGCRAPVEGFDRVEWLGHRRRLDRPHARGRARGRRRPPGQPDQQPGRCAAAVPGRWLDAALKLGADVDRQHRCRRSVRQRRHPAPVAPHPRAAAPTWSSAIARSARSSTSRSEALLQRLGSWVVHRPRAPMVPRHDLGLSRLQPRRQPLQLVRRLQLHLHAREPDPGGRNLVASRAHPDRRQPRRARVAALRLRPAA